MKVGIALLALVLLIAALVVLRAKVKAPSTSADDIQVGMKDAAAEAVGVAKAKHGVTLDYSPRSVEAVEAILAKLHEEHREAPFSLAREKEEGWRWGAYVGEVILRLTPGHWEMDHVAAGKGSFPVRVARGDSFPIGWCRKRIVNGPEDNVWHKFQILYLREGADSLKAQASGAAHDPDAREP